VQHRHGALESALGFRAARDREDDAAEFPHVVVVALLRLRAEGRRGGEGGSEGDA
jgi:hypothetical protein